MGTTNPKPGEVWFADLEMIENGRPVVVLSYPGDREARALAIVVPLTSRIRGATGEVDIGHPKWLPKHSAVNVQGLASIDRHKLTRKFGVLDPSLFEEVKTSLRNLLEL